MIGYHAIDPGFTFMAPAALRPTEEIHAERVGEVVAMILRHGAWTHPICVERTVHALLDGHHRLAAARALGLVRVPVRILDYAEVELASWRPEIVPNRDEVLARALSGDLYPHKTTRHTFRDRPMRPVPLASLIDSEIENHDLVQRRGCHPDIVALRPGPSAPGGRRI